MKKLVYILMFGLYSCTNLVGQGQDEEFEKDQELIKLMNQFSKTSAKNEVAQGKADDKSKEIVTKAVETISTLQEENKALKQELNEIKQKLDDISNDTSNKFQLRPISDSKKDGK
jgi:seryl-tRNA synthetase